MSPLVGTDVVVRPARQEDAEACGRICYEAFRAIAEHHGFPPDFPAPETAIGVIADLLAHPSFHGVVAEHDGVILGSNFLDERCQVAGLGPITVDPAAQDAQVGRRLMLALLDRARERVGRANDDLEALIGTTDAYGGPRLSRASAQRGPLPLVPRTRAACRPGDDPDDRRVLPRAVGPVPAVDPLLSQMMIGTVPPSALHAAPVT
jgi:GNAT superfamily N-acetyltransferase